MHPDGPIVTKTGIIVGNGRGEQRATGRLPRDLADRKGGTPDHWRGSAVLELDHLPMAWYYTPGESTFLKHEALEMGFRHVESGPLVRSSYHAHEQAQSTGLVSK